MQLGQRQQAIVTLLEAGSYSFEALLLQLADRPEDRRLATASIKRLADNGLITVIGRKGKHVLDGAMVALSTATYHNV